MKIRKHLIDDFKLIARIHKNAGRTSTASYKTVFIAGRLKSTHGRSSDGKYRPSLLFCLIYFLRSFRRNGKNFLMHFVIFNHFFTDRKESSQSYVKRNERALNSLCIKPGKHFFRKMKPCRRTSSASCIHRIHILIALGIFFRIFTLNIRRKRNMTVFLKPVFRNYKIKLKRAEFSSFIPRAFNDCTNSSVRERIAHSRLLLFCVLHHCIPDAAVPVYLIKKHKFRFAPGSFLYSVTARTANTRIIEYHQSIRRNQLRKVIHCKMSYSAVVFSKAHKLILTAYSAWMLGN